MRAEMGVKMKQAQQPKASTLCEKIALVPQEGRRGHAHRRSAREIDRD
jgi:hypothetical protein